MLEAVLFVAVYLITLATGLDDVKVHLMSFNIRTSLAMADAGARCSNWDGIRKDNVLNNIKTVAADFVGTQETSDAQKGYLDAHLAATYSVIGESTGSLNGNAAEWNAMYYRSDSWTLLKQGMFWLGPDPNTMSAGWGMAYYRTCVWGRFQHIATGATVCVLNTHYETPGNDEAQENGSNIILERIKTNCDASDNLIVLMGDFNALKSYSAMQILFEHDMEDPSDEGTFCGDMLSATCSVKYDFTLFRTQSQDACYLKSEISRIEYDGCYTSDHAGIVGTFCLQGSCCSNSSNSSSSSGSDEPYILDDSSIASERDVLGKVQAPDTENSKTGPNADTASSSSDVHQMISTLSSGGNSASVTVGSILGSLGVCGLVAFVVIRRKKKLDEQACLEKMYDSDVSTHLGAARSVFEMSALSPLPEEDDIRASTSTTIPELAAIPRHFRISTSSSVSASNSEIARHGGRVPELHGLSSVSNISSRRSSTAVMDPANSEYSSAFSNSVLENEGDFNESVINAYAESYGISSIALGKAKITEVFALDSCVSENSALAKTQADFTKL